VLVNLKQEVANIFITISHSGQPFYFVVDSFRDGRCNLAAEIIEDEMSLPEELESQRNECRNAPILWRRKSIILGTAGQYLSLYR